MNEEPVKTNATPQDPPAPPVTTAELTLPPPALQPNDSKKKEDRWWKVIALVMSAFSLLVAGYAALNTHQSANAATRSADAATRSAEAAGISANAALTNADWASYQRNPHHDLRAKVLRVNPVLTGYSSEDTNGLLYVDIALINNGNQTEIVRRINIYYAKTEAQNDGEYSPRILNMQIGKGEKQVLHLKTEHESVWTGTNLWLKIGVTVIGPNAEDIESKWLVAYLSLAKDANGAQMSEFPTNAISLVSEKLMPYQRRFEVHLGD